jgi:predicted nucleotide-binding protein
MNVGRFDFAFGGGNETTWEHARAKKMKTRLEILDGLVDLLDSQVELAATGSANFAQSPSNADRIGNTVFLVHGHDDAVIHDTARLLERFDLNVIILRELPYSGRTIIEKFVDYSNVGFAVVLLTGDDRGGVKSIAFDAQKLRARQNVILELGFFLGKLGRSRVCALHQEDVEIPSDYDGVLFLPLDRAGAWRLALARELKAGGLDIDLNKAI